MSRYRKSWTEALKEIRDHVPEKNKESDKDYHYGHEPQGMDDQYTEHLEESAALQLKMAFDDAGIKIKSVKGGKLVVAKKDMKKVEKVIAKQMKDKSAAKRVLGSQIIFEEMNPTDHVQKNKETGMYCVYDKDGKKVKEFKDKKDADKYAIDNHDALMHKEEVDLDEAETAYPPTIKNLKMIVKDKQNQVFMFPSGKARVDLFTASAMVQVYDALKPATKKKFEDMIKSKEGFMKSQAFAMKMAK